MNSGDGHNDGDRTGPLFQHRNAYDLNSKIMLTAIISLSAVVLLVVLLHIYARFIIRRTSRRRFAHLRLDLAASADGNRPADPQPKPGLDPSVISALPVLTFKKVAAAGGAAECAVCLSGLEEEEPARLLPNCKHAFHLDCVDTWLRSHSTCPICRTEVEPEARLEPLSREPPEPTTRVNSEGLSSSSNQNKSGGGGPSMLRVGSFRRTMSWERASRRIQPGGGPPDATEDLERG